MVHTKIIIKKKNDPTPALEGITSDTKIVNGTIDTMIILEGGMESGKTAVVFHINLPDGSVLIAQTSAAIFETMAGALRGAEQRFEDDQTIQN